MFEGAANVISSLKLRFTESNLSSMRLLVFSVVFECELTASVFQVAFYEEERDIMAKATSPWITQLEYAFQVSMVFDMAVPSLHINQNSSIYKMECIYCQCLVQIVCCHGTLCIKT